MTNGLPGLAGKIALVTGAGGGIGAATARLLAAQGCRVLLNDLDEAAAKAVADELGDAAVFAANVAEAAAVNAMFERAEREFGGVDLLVNNAGIVTQARLHEFPDEDWDRVLDVNLKGVYLCTKAYARAALERGRGGAICNIASMAYKGMTQQIAYASSKGGVVSLTKSAAMELARQGIRVNVVAPGMISTVLTKDLDSLRERMMPAIPLRRFGEPEEIAWAIAYLLSDAASYVTGETVHVSGGARL